MSKDGEYVLDGWEAFHPFSPVCWRCAHKTATVRHVCAAFPAGIPRAIWLGENDHTQPYPGDNGIQFTPRQPSGGTGKA